MLLGFFGHFSISTDMSTFFSYVLKPKFSSYPISPVPLGQLALKKERKKEVKKAHWVCLEILQLTCQN